MRNHNTKSTHTPVSLYLTPSSQPHRIRQAGSTLPLERLEVCEKRLRDSVVASERRHLRESQSAIGKWSEGEVTATHILFTEWRDKKPITLSEDGRFLTLQVNARAHARLHTRTQATPAAHTQLAHSHTFTFTPHPHAQADETYTAKLAQGGSTLILSDTFVEGFGMDSNTWTRPLHPPTLKDLPRVFTKRGAGELGFGFFGGGKMMKRGVTQRGIRRVTI